MNSDEWKCSFCDLSNYATRQKCRRCKKWNQEFKARGDWLCRDCDYWNYKTRKMCRKCNKLDRNLERKGDWICSKCNSHNCADRLICHRPQCGNKVKLESVYALNLFPGGYLDCPSCHNIINGGKICFRCKKILKNPKEGTLTFKKAGSMTCVIKKIPNDDENVLYGPLTSSGKVELKKTLSFSLVHEYRNILNVYGSHVIPFLKQILIPKNWVVIFNKQIFHNSWLSNGQVLKLDPKDDEILKVNNVLELYYKLNERVDWSDSEEWLWRDENQEKHVVTYYRVMKY